MRFKAGPLPPVKRQLSASSQAQSAVSVPPPPNQGRRLSPTPLIADAAQTSGHLLVPRQGHTWE